MYFFGVLNENTLYLDEKESKNTFPHLGKFTQY